LQVTAGKEVRWANRWVAIRMICRAWAMWIKTDDNTAGVNYQASRNGLGIRMTLKLRATSRQTGYGGSWSGQVLSVAGGEFFLDLAANGDIVAAIAARSGSAASRRNTLTQPLSGRMYWRWARPAATNSSRTFFGREYRPGRGRGRARFVCGLPLIRCDFLSCSWDRHADLYGREDQLRAMQWQGSYVAR
jgi:hypothetical protein